MDFRTCITIPPSNLRITHRNSILALGSCFAESMTEMLTQMRYNIVCNPFGALYNPLSIVRHIKRVASNSYYSDRDIIEWQGRWFSTDAHTLLESSNMATAIEQMNKALERAHNALESADFVIITLGSDFVYERGGEVVANCHKLPAREFTRRRASIEEMVSALDEVFTQELSGKQIILTVSPIRHLKDGLAECSLSKASLRVVAARLAEKWDNAHYFPSYEIMMDELRDYRFYASDMLHPSEVAIQYIGTRFKEAWLDPKEEVLNQRIERFVKGCQHRPFDNTSEQYRQFTDGLYQDFVALKTAYPELDFSQEKIFLSQAGYNTDCFNKK